MALQIGDPIFTRTGTPGFIKERSEAKESVVSDVNEAAVKTQFRHGYIRGLSSDARQEFNGIMDRIRTLDQGPEKVRAMQKTIDEMENVPEKKPETMMFIRYLKSELFHLMQVYNIHPQEYSIPFHELNPE